MAQKIKPTALRLGVTQTWKSRWFFGRSQKFFLEEDVLIRDLIKEKLLQAGLAGIEIERTGEMIRVSIRSSRPGLIIGRGGKGVEDLKKELERAIRKLRRQNSISLNFVLNINVEELRRGELAAAVIAQQIAFDIEKRLPFRLVMRRHLEAIRQNREIQGAKIKLSGRLNGAEISRREWLAFGRVPLQTLRANIDYAEATSFCSYGAVGVKVWLYKGEIFDE